MADAADVLLLKIAQHDDLAVARGETVEGFVQDRGQLEPVSILAGVVVESIDFHGNPFPFLAAVFGAKGFQGGVASMAVQPAAEDGAVRERMSFAGEVGEDQLRHILGQMDIAAGHPPGGGIDQGKVALDQFPKGRLGALANVLGEVLRVVIHGTVHII